MKIFTSPLFDLPLPPGHRFPGHKYELLRRELLSERILEPDMLHASPAASRDDLTLAHDPLYVDAVMAGTLGADAMRRIGLPWSPHLAARAAATAGGAVAALRAALDDGLSGQLAGGTHHAHRDFGAGFCIFNDFAVAALKAIAEGWVSRVAILDLDVHQGDGNAAILAAHPAIFVASVHGAKNFPFRKVPSDLDIGLADGAADREYLHAVEVALDAVLAFMPDVILYQAGVDALSEDKLGRLDVTFTGLMQRDEMVFRACQKRGIPVSMAIGGGYSDPIAATVAAYVNTYRVARSVFGF